MMLHSIGLAAIMHGSLEAADRMIPSVSKRFLRSADVQQRKSKVDLVLW